jgi:transcriptional regulator with XRE-family HTH domain
MKTEAIPPEPTTFAAVLADANIRKVAEAAGVSVQAAHQWKRGFNLPGLDLVPKIARVLGWPTSKLESIVIRERRERDEKARAR